MTTRPYRQYTALAQLMHLLAREANEALQHCLTERQHLDGWTATTLGDGTPRGTTTGTIPERTTEAHIEIDAYINQITDDITTIATIAASALDVCHKAKGHRAPHDKPEEHTYCRDNQVKRDGAIVWGDVTCLNLPDKAGLCSSCYQREWRWRKTQNLGPRDTEPAA